MSVVSCKLARTPRDGRFYIDDKGAVKGECIVYWDVVTDNVTDGWVTVYTEAKTSTPDPLPEFFDTYAIGGESDTALYFGDAVPTQDPAALTKWTIRGIFRSLPSGLTSGDAVADPLMRPWKYRLENETVSEAVTEATLQESLTRANGDSKTAGSVTPLVNAAFQDYDETVSKPIRNTILVGEKNYATLDVIHTIQRTYGDSLNSDIFLGYPPNHCRFLGITSSELINEGDVEYYRASVRILLSEKDLFFRAINRGWKEWKQINGNWRLVNILDEKQNEISEPAFLKADGSRPSFAALNEIKESISYRLEANTVDYNSIFS